MTPSESAAPISNFEQRVGHPPGLFMLFFAEMWERFSYYGMRALLVFYMTKGFLGYGDELAYHTYGAYSSLVYMTPFIGGLIADRLLGPRRSVIFGGLLMAAGHLLMTVETKWGFFFALALLICGNGFFKPNISTMVGSLYHARNKEKRDGGFTIFYMGINLGAAMAPLLCGYVGETYGWHYGFGLATAGMLIGLAVFVMPSLVTQILIGIGALAAGGGLFYKCIGKDAIVALDNVPIGAAVLIAAGFAVWALQGGSLPKGTGDAPTQDGLNKKTLITVIVTLVVAVPAAALLVTKSDLAGIFLAVFGGAAMLYLFVSALRGTKLERDRIFVCLVMFFFSTLFWAFFEQAGSSMNNFADRNVDRVVEAGVITAADVGKTVDIDVTQEQFGYEHDGKVFTMTDLDAAKKDGKVKQQWLITQAHIGMKTGGTVVPASEFQAANPGFILMFGPVFTFLWAFLAHRRREPSIPGKFAWAFVQLSAGFAVLWWGAGHADARGMVGAWVLLLAYLLHTTGEICLSPVGLSMVTKLSPKVLVSTMMGGWFLATAFSEFLAGRIATLTGVTGGEAGGAQTIPAPIDTVHVYGDVFGKIAVAAAVAGALCFALVPLLKKWMHLDVPMTGEDDETEAPAH